MRANVILHQLPLARGFPDESQKVRFEAEARFMRGWFYFLLARNFGPVPLVTEVITQIANARVPNSEPAALWDHIESDLLFAAQNLPPEWNADNLGRATRYSAWAYLGQLRLYRAQWFDLPQKYGEAIQAFEQVVASGRYQLVPDYGDNFRMETENNAESVFEIQFTPGNGGQNAWLPSDFGAHQNQNVGYAGSGRLNEWGPACGPGGQCAPTTGNWSNGNVHITPGLQNAFEPGDPRRYYTMYSDGEEYVWGIPYSSAWSVTGATPAKYLRPFRTEQFPPIMDTNNERVMRYADVLLMLAEAKLLGNGDVAGAAALVNQVRRRARTTYEILNGEPAPPTLLQDVPAAGTPQQWFRQHLEPERRVELALEMSRYDDLVRWHRAALINIPVDVDFGNPMAQQGWNERHLLKPVPLGEMDLNPELRQNPGY